MRFSAVPAAAITAALACTLTACGGGSPEPPPLDSPAPTTSATSAQPSAGPSPTRTIMAPSPSPSDDVVQTGGTGKVDSATKASAIAFTGKLLDALDEGGANGNFAKALALFDKTCTTCKAGIAYAQSIYAKNQKIVGGQYNNPKYSVLASPVADVIVRVDSTVAAYRVVNASGKTVGSAKSQDNIANYHLKKSGSSWLVVRWSQS